MDNIPITSGAGLTVATDEDGGGLQHQWVKIKFGGDGAFTAVTTAAGFPVQILSLPDLGLNSSVRITSLPDLGLNSSVKIISLPAFAVGSSVTISNLASTPLTFSGTTIAITSLPDLGLNSSVKITSLPAFAVGSTVSCSNGQIVSVTGISVNGVNITSLPDLGLNSSVKITSLPNFAVGQIISISGLTSASVSISNLSTIIQIVSGTTIAITSLPALGFGGLVSISNNAIVQLATSSNLFSFTSTYTSAQTNAVLLSPPGNISAAGSLTSYYITDVIFSNNSTQGNMSLIESRPNAAIRTKIASLYFMPYGGASLSFTNPIVLETNAALCMTSQTVTAHSVTVIGYRQ